MKSNAYIPFNIIFVIYSYVLICIYFLYIHIYIYMNVKHAETEILKLIPNM